MSKPTVDDRLPESVDECCPLRNCHLNAARLNGYSIGEPRCSWPGHAAAARERAEAYERARGAVKEYRRELQLSKRDCCDRSVAVALDEADAAILARSKGTR